MGEGLDKCGRETAERITRVRTQEGEKARMRRVMYVVGYKASDDAARTSSVSL